MQVDTEGVADRPPSECYCRQMDPDVHLVGPHANNCLARGIETPVRGRLGCEGSVEKSGRAARPVLPSIAIKSVLGGAKVTLVVFLAPSVRKARVEETGRIKNCCSLIGLAFFRSQACGT